MMQKSRYICLLALLLGATVEVLASQMQTKDIGINKAQILEQSPETGDDELTQRFEKLKPGAAKRRRATEAEKRTVGTERVNVSRIEKAIAKLEPLTLISPLENALSAFSESLKKLSTKLAVSAATTLATPLIEKNSTEFNKTLSDLLMFVKNAPSNFYALAAGNSFVKLAQINESLLGLQEPIEEKLMIMKERSFLLQENEKNWSTQKWSVTTPNNDIIEKLVPVAINAVEMSLKSAEQLAKKIKPVDKRTWYSQKELKLKEEHEKQMEENKEYESLLKNFLFTSQCWLVQIEFIQFIMKQVKFDDEELKKIDSSMQSFNERLKKIKEGFSSSVPASKDVILSELGLEEEWKKGGEVTKAKQATKSFGQFVTNLTNELTNQNLKDSIVRFLQQIKKVLPKEITNKKSGKKRTVFPVNLYALAPEITGFFKKIDELVGGINENTVSSLTIQYGKKNISIATFYQEVRVYLNDTQRKNFPFLEKIAKASKQGYVVPFTLESTESSFSETGDMKMEEVD